MKKIYYNKCWKYFIGAIRNNIKNEYIKVILKIAFLE
jgi:hypothetical protein